MRPSEPTGDAARTLKLPSVAYTMAPRSAAAAVVGVDFTEVPIQSIIAVAVTADPVWSSCDPLASGLGSSGSGSLLIWTVPQPVTSNVTTAQDGRGPLRWLKAVIEPEQIAPAMPRQ